MCAVNGQEHIALLGKGNSNLAVFELVVSAGVVSTVEEAPQVGAGDGGLIIAALLGPLDLLTLHGNNAILAVNSDLALGGHSEGDVVAHAIGNPAGGGALHTDDLQLVVTGGNGAAPAVTAVGLGHDQGRSVGSPGAGSFPVADDDILDLAALFVGSLATGLIAAIVGFASGNIAQGQAAVSVLHQSKGDFHATGNEHLLGLAFAQRNRLLGAVSFGHVPVGIVTGLDEDIAILRKGSSDLAVNELIFAQVLVIIVAAVVSAVDVADQVEIIGIASGRSGRIDRLAAGHIGISLSLGSESSDLIVASFVLLVQNQQIGLCSIQCHVYGLLIGAVVDNDVGNILADLHGEPGGSANLCHGSAGPCTGIKQIGAVLADPTVQIGSCEGRLSVNGDLILGQLGSCGGLFDGAANGNGELSASLGGILKVGQIQLQGDILRLAGNIKRNVIARIPPCVGLNAGTLELAAPVHIPAAVCRELDLVAGANRNILIGDGINITLNGHSIGCRAGIPAGAVEPTGLAVTNSIHLLNIQTGNSTDTCAACLDSLGIGIKSDGNIAGRIHLEGVVLTALTPGIVPSAIGNLTAVSTGCHIGIDLGIDTVAGIGHNIVGILAGPLHAAECCYTRNVVFACSHCDHRNHAENHAQHDCHCDQFFHVFSLL